MRDAGVLPDVSDMMTLAGFALHSSSVSYVAAGSFCRHLIDRHGIGAMTRTYRSLRFDEEYGKPLPALMEEWHLFLDSIDVAGEDRLAVDALFRRPPIFRKVCARVVAERNREAGKLFAAGDYPRAAARYKESFADGRGNDALAGWLDSAQVHAVQFAHSYEKAPVAVRLAIAPRPTRQTLIYALNFGVNSSISF